jgi:hypothetical protein
LLTLPAQTQAALGLSRTTDEQQAAAKTAGEDWVRLLGPRLSERDAQQLRGVLVDWELGRGAQTCFGLLGGHSPGAFLIADVADAARLKRAGAGFFGLFNLPGVRAPLVEFVGQPRVSEPAAPGNAQNVTRRRLTFVASAGKRPLPALSFAWSIDERRAVAAASLDADQTLNTLLESERGARDTLGRAPGVADSVQRIGSRTALYAYLDARLALAAASEQVGPAAPVFFALGKRERGAALRAEFAKPALDLALRGALGF